MLFRDGRPVVEGGAGQGEVLRGLEVGAGPDEGVLAGVPAAQCDPKRVCGHDSDSFYLWAWLLRAWGYIKRVARSVLRSAAAKPMLSAQVAVSPSCPGRRSARIPLPVCGPPAAC